MDESHKNLLKSAPTEEERRLIHDIFPTDIGPRVSRLLSQAAQKVFMPGLKGPLTASRNRIVCPSVCP